MAPLRQREFQHPATMRDLLFCEDAPERRLQHNRRVNVGVLPPLRTFGAKTREATHAVALATDVIGMEKMRATVRAEVAGAAAPIRSGQ